MKVKELETKADEQVQAEHEAKIIKEINYLKSNLKSSEKHLKETKKVLEEFMEKDTDDVDLFDCDNLYVVR